MGTAYAEQKGVTPQGRHFMLRSFYQLGADESGPGRGWRRVNKFAPLMAVIDRALYISVAGLALCLILIAFE
jgi:hypothetical protein